MGWKDIFKRNKPALPAFQKALKEVGELEQKIFTTSADTSRAEKLYGSITDTNETVRSQIEAKRNAEIIAKSEYKVKINELLACMDKVKLDINVDLIEMNSQNYFLHVNVYSEGKKLKPMAALTALRAFSVVGEAKERSSLEQRMDFYRKSCDNNVTDNLATYMQRGDMSYYRINLIEFSCAYLTISSMSSPYISDKQWTLVSDRLENLGNNTEATITLNYTDRKPTRKEKVMAWLRHAKNNCYIG